MNVKSPLKEHLAHPRICFRFRHSEDFDSYADYLSDCLLIFQSNPLHYGVLAQYEPEFASALDTLLTAKGDKRLELPEEAEMAAIEARSLYQMLCEHYIVHYYGIDPKCPDEPNPLPEIDLVSDEMRRPSSARSGPSI